MKHQKPHKTLLVKRQYDSLVSKAVEFASALTGDAGYEKPWDNRLALESMLIGWLRGTRQWNSYERYCRIEHPKENVYLVAQDQAMQAAQDAIQSDGELFAFFYSVEELNAMIADTPALKKPALIAKMMRGKATLKLSVA